jgi:hypothetical protein
MVGGHKTLFHWVHNHHKELGYIYLRVKQTAITAVCEGWMVGWMVGRQKHFSIGSTPNTRATNAPCGVDGGQWDKETLFSHWVDIHTQMSQLVHGEGWMISRWESLFPLGSIVCAYAASSPLQQSTETKRENIFTS